MLIDRLNITDKVAIVTGAGRGIGRATALGLAEQGADLVLAARTQAQLDVVADEVQALGRKAVVVAADLNDTANLSGLVDAAVAQFGHLDIVINNVGGSMPAAFLDTTEQAFEAAFHFNVTTAFALSKAATPAMLEAGGGAIVNISSAMGRLADRGFIAYGTAKGALAHMTQLMASDLAPRIRVNAIAVGSTATSALEIVLTNDDLRNMMIEGTPLKRLGEPEDIALAALYLASPAAAFVTGKIFEIDGGIGAPNLALGLPDL